jgi:predicted nucleic acid-binding Zn ribbon protein
MHAVPPFLTVEARVDGRLVVRLVDERGPERTLMIRRTSLNMVVRDWIFDRRPCVVCGDVIVGRKGSTFCGDACKSKDWRRRHRAP